MNAPTKNAPAKSSPTIDDEIRSMQAEIAATARTELRLKDELAGVRKQANQDVAEAKAQFHAMCEATVDETNPKAVLRALNNIREAYQFHEEMIAKRIEETKPLKEHLAEVRKRLRELCENANQLRLPLD